MNEKLQELTRKIYEEGLEKGKKEAEEIIQKARKDADEILKNAGKESDAIRNEAKRFADDLKKNVNSELMMTSKQAITAVKQQITDLLVAKSVDEALKKVFDDKDFLRTIIIKIIESWNETGATGTDVVLTLPEKDRKNLEDFFMNKVAGHVKTGFELRFDENVGGGFKIGPKDGSFKISFTDQDFEQFFRHYLRPRTIKLLYGEK